MWWNKYLPIPFKEKGRTFEGCDCWGLVRLILQEKKAVSLPSYDDLYESTKDKKAVESAIIDGTEDEWIPVLDPQPFDMVLLDILGIPMHVGIVTKEGFMLHCMNGVGTVHEDYTSVRWVSRVKGFYRWRGLIQ